MRKSAGFGILGLGILGLIWWASVGYTARMEAKVRAGADVVAAIAIHQVSAITSGRDITLTGLVDSANEREALLAALEAVEGSRTVLDETTLLPKLSPYVTEAYKAPGEAIITTGAVPQAAWRSALKEAGAEGTQRLDLTGGAPEDWLPVMQAGLRGLTLLSEGTLRLEDRQLTLSGLARDPATRDRMRAAVGLLPEGFSFDDAAVRLRDDGTPPAFTVTLAEDGTARVEGKLPEGVNRADIADALGRESVDGETTTGLMGMQDGPAGLAGVTALSALVSGAFTYDDGRLTLTGAATPEGHADMLAALQGLPESYDLDMSGVTLMDAGTPWALTLTLDANGTARASGTWPVGFDGPAAATALGVQRFEDDAEARRFGQDVGPDMAQRLRALRPYLGLTERAEITLDAEGTRVSLEVQPGVTLTVLEASLENALPEMDVALSRARVTVQEGTRRSNAFTGARERATGGFWLPDVSFTPNRQTCAAQSQAVLAAAKISFVTGSAELDPLSLATINRMASVVRPCVVQGGLVAEIGGHTDAVGDSGANFRLSYDRAQSVATALRNRGIPSVGLRAVGYGATEPVADNDTEEGRAANRRTTLVWTNLAQ